MLMHEPAESEDVSLDANTESDSVSLDANVWNHEPAESDGVSLNANTESEVLALMLIQNQTVLALMLTIELRRLKEAHHVLTWYKKLL